MQTLFSKGRYPLCLLIILAFFLPSYQNISAFSFVPQAFSFAEDQSEISSADVLIAVVPLVLIPLSSVLIMVQTYLRKVIRQSIKALPFICLSLFTVILFLSLRTLVGSGMTTLRILSHLGAGFYLTLIASALVPFTKSPYRRKTRRVAVAEAEVA